MSIKDNLDHIHVRIRAACQRVGRDPEEIILVGVTKTVEADMMNEAFKCGVVHFGENRVQEVVRKQPDIIGEPKWHLIGHLQTNKVKHIIDKVDMIHSVDSMRLLEEIGSRASHIGKTMEILIQLNVADEESKFGTQKEELKRMLTYVSENNGLKVLGLMTIAPFTDDPEDVRIYFKELKNIFDALKTENIKNVEMKYLSMGMTGDFEVAIEEGANIIRVGTGIFGVRDYT